MYPYRRLLEEGYEVHIAAPSVKKLQFVVHDFGDGYDTYTEKAGYTWPADIAFADVDRPTTWPWSSRAAGHRSTSATMPLSSASGSTS
jgi:putative intracellular protease/amidase